jgi:flagellin-like protein
MGIGGSLGRRGMSPLIATILLMAFAVALGGMIMNISIDSSANEDCEQIKIQVSKFCAADNKILLSLRNDKQSVPLRQIKLSFVQAGIENTLSIKDSDLTLGQPLEEIAVSTSISPGTRVDVIGVVGNENNPVVCTDPIAQADPIKEC